MKKVLWIGLIFCSLFLSSVYAQVSEGDLLLGASCNQVGLVLPNITIRGASIPEMEKTTSFSLAGVNKPAVLDATLFDGKNTKNVELSVGVGSMGIKLGETTNLTVGLFTFSGAWCGREMDNDRIGDFRHKSATLGSVDFTSINKDTQSYFQIVASPFQIASTKTITDDESQVRTKDNYTGVCLDLSAAANIQSGKLALTGTCNYFESKTDQGKVSYVKTDIMLSYKISKSGWIVYTEYENTKASVKNAVTGYDNGMGTIKAGIGYRDFSNKIAKSFW